MNKYLKELIDVSLLDKEIDLMEPKFKQIKKELNLKLYQKEAKKLEIVNLEEQKETYELQIQKSNESLEIQNTRLEELGKKMSEVKTEKELKALNIEEELAREQITYQNSELNRLDALKDNVDEKINVIQEEITKIDTEIVEIEKTISVQLAEIHKEQEAISKKKAIIVEKMDQKIVLFYEKIRKWAKNTSVVPVYKQACGGCFIRISDRVYSEILKGDDIITCPHCGRILYIQEDLNAQDGKICASWLLFFTYSYLYFCMSFSCPIVC
ncbi:zinc ribbon domain-containing protein [Helicobacter pylori]